MNAFAKIESLEDIRLGVERLRGDSSVQPVGSIVVPVNAQGDLEIAVALLRDLVSYNGPYTFEIVLLVNNFPPGRPPSGIEAFEGLGLRVETVPDVWRRGEAVCFSARMVGIKAASSEGRASAMILSSLPILMFIVIQIITPDFYASVWNEDLTKICLAGAAGWMAIGNFIMFRMVNFRI